MKTLAPFGLAMILGCFFFGGLIASKPPEVRISAYASPLEGRLKGQRQNAALSLDKLNGVIIPAGAEFSFNKTVGTWSRDAGYRKAPVSFNGQLVWTWGGGVCQTSSTLYNAALLAGMEIAERNRHRFAPGYVPPGRDAAVAYNNIDLRFRNPYKFPVRILARVEDDRLLIEFFGKAALRDQIFIREDLRGVRLPDVLVDRPNFDSSNARGRGVMNPGKAGFSTTTYRIFRGPDGERRELLSVDEYPAMSRVLAR